ncbi:hypothetical protein JAAARDRAFT_155966 [Jaapia argillacea MUCL 33604]|uniref:Uncharacterized protein n=1 Tax=Jaapia argillacea MUCL 33604 TaxID=933084 RepID=A0A067PTX4_9AGAM|nr:hypothetical protein JAAARDRAFT_155966 [Jaapia argillacea MUCL 33604]
MSLWKKGVAFVTQSVLTVDFGQCLAEVNNGTWGTIGGTDNHGNPVPIGEATGITYALCKTACGVGPEKFTWSSFSPQFSAWLLPYLALVSQIPFGTGNKWSNFVSVLLTVGSPTLAAYCLALTVLNTRWAISRFQDISFPNAKNAAFILTALQQSCIYITPDHSLLASLIILEENDDWWRRLAKALNYTSSWTIATAVSVVWVVIAFIFTLVDSFTGIWNMGDPVALFGQGVGFLWLWLLPLVIGWQQLSPICDPIRVGEEVDKINAEAFVATESGGVVKAVTLVERRAIAVTEPQDEPFPNRRHRRSICHDARLSATPFYYARVFAWFHAVEDVAVAFSAASRNTLEFCPDDESSHEYGSRKYKRTGSAAELTESCRPWEDGEFSSLTGLYHRMLIASGLAIGLQWGTTGAAIVVVYLTPTVGLGCQSGAYLLYGLLSTVVFVLMFISSVLAHCAYPQSHRTYTAPPNTTVSHLAASLSIGLRRLGKVIAAFNTVWVVLMCLFQLGGFFNRCYCNSCMLSLGHKAYSVLQFTVSDLAGMETAWIGGSILAVGSCIIFIAFVNLWIDFSSMRPL